MQYIHVDQHIRRRQDHGPVSFRTPAVYKPYKYIDEIKQNPAHIKRRHREIKFRISLFHLFGKAGKPQAPAGENVSSFFDAGNSGETARREGVPFFDLLEKILPLREFRGSKNPFWTSPAPACVLAGVAIFSALVLAWQNPPVMALSPGEDHGGIMHLASYAGISPLMPVPVSPRSAPTEAFPPGEGGAIPLDLIETFRWESYQVQKGDSVSGIAAARSISIDAIIASNGIANAKRLREGDVIRIPNMDGIPYTVKRGDSLNKISTAMGVPLSAILDANNLESNTITAGMTLFIPGAKMRREDLKLALGELFVYPIRGQLTSPYGWRNDPFGSGVRRYHAALDLAARLGTPVKASMDGRVETVGLNATFGKYIIISHDSGYQTMYAHLNSTSVTQGSYVYQGSKIGEVGSTGYSTGPHLHFALYKNGRPINPLEFLNS
jgi:murein DD-endopeptidase MepM/ murein hydrolase activator NlpD